MRDSVFFVKPLGGTLRTRRLGCTGLKRYGSMDQRLTTFAEAITFHKLFISSAVFFG